MKTKNNKFSIINYQLSIFNFSIFNSRFQILNHKPHRVYGPELYVVQGSRFLFGEILGAKEKMVSDETS
jgi:hypothetical protein